MNARGPVRRLAIARFTSVAGTEAGQLALAVAIYLRTHSTAWLAGAMLATPVIVGILAPVSGWIADHVERRLVIAAAEAGAGGVYVALIFARQPVTLVALALLASAVNAPLRAALAAAVPNLAPSDELTWANGLLGATANAAVITGPAVGGALVTRAGPGAVFALDAATFLVSAAITARIPGSFSGPCRQGRSRAGAGFALIAADPCMVMLVAQSCLASFALGLVTLADLPLASSFGAGPVGYGLLTGLWSARHRCRLMAGGPGRAGNGGKDGRRRRDGGHGGDGRRGCSAAFLLGHCCHRGARRRRRRDRVHALAHAHAAPIRRSEAGNGHGRCRQLRTVRLRHRHGCGRPGGNRARRSARLSLPRRRARRTPIAATCLKTSPHCPAQTQGGGQPR